MRNTLCAFLSVLVVVMGLAVVVSELAPGKTSALAHDPAPMMTLNNGAVVTPSQKYMELYLECFKVLDETRMRSALVAAKCVDVINSAAVCARRSAPEYSYGWSKHGHPHTHTLKESP